MNTPPDANYRYWQESGKEWPEIYQDRMQWQVLYHLQEFYLLDYFQHTRPARVLEFGCGYGRHLKNLLPLEGLEVYGHDQSPTMIERMADWADPDWLKGHVSLGGPVSRLPYEDGFFDVVYTAEVLVHVRPDDLAAVLAELLRVSRWQVLHLETAPQAQLNPEIHGGCWKHDLGAAYRDLGHQMEELTQCYQVHLPSRVLLDPSRAPYTMPSASAARLARLEMEVQPGIKKGIQALEMVANNYRDLEELLDHNRAKQVEVKHLEQILGNLEVRTLRLEKERNELREESSRRIADLERLEAEYKSRIAQLTEEAVLAKQEAQRANRRLQSRSSHWENALETQRRRADWAQARLEISRERFLELQDTYDVQRHYLINLEADRDHFSERYAGLLRTLDELAGWGNR